MAEAESPRKRVSRWGIRAEILLGLALVTLFAVLSTGFLVLWAGGSSLRMQRESAALAMATAAAATAAAVIDADKPLDDPDNRTRLKRAGNELAQKGELLQVSYLAPDRRVVVSDPPREPGDVDPPILLAVLNGVAPSLNYRTQPATGATEIVSYAPIAMHNRILGAARILQDAPSPTAVVIQRSGWVLVALALADAFLVIALGYLVLTQLVVRPLRTMERATTLVAAGQWDQAITTDGPREVLALAAAFNQMTASLASQREQLIRTEKLASVGQLAAGVAHEVGNPLAAILGFVDILREAEQDTSTLSPGERRDLLERVKAETQRIHRTIQDLLAYSRPSVEQPQPTDPFAVYKSAQGLLEAQQRFRGVRLLSLPLDVPRPTWPRVLVSPGRLQQVLVNLLINAADAMDGQGTVTVSCGLADGLVRIRVADTGPGVAPELRRKIFDPFVTTKSPGQGTGLGLAISRSIVETYGGTLDLDAAAAPGAVFVITLPGE